MPHTSRRRQVVADAHAKLLYVQDADGWNHVVRNARPRSMPAHLHASSQEIDDLHTRLDAAPDIDNDLLRNPYGRRRPIYNDDELLKSFDRLQEIWKRSNARTVLDGQITNKAVCKGFTKSVCLGLGSVSGDPTGWKKHCMWQLVVWLDFVQRYGSQQDGLAGFRLFAQDPMFNEVDERFLATHGVQVLNDPEAFKEIDEKTFVYAPHFPHRLWPEPMRTGTVLVMIANDIDDNSLRHLTARAHDQSVDDALKKAVLQKQEQLQALADKVHHFSFPAPEEAEHAFSQLSIFWKTDYD